MANFDLESSLACYGGCECELKYVMEGLKSQTKQH